jgi:hypothetical protein
MLVVGTRVTIDPEGGQVHTSFVASSTSLLPLRNHVAQVSVFLADLTTDLRLVVAETLEAS